MEKLYRSEKDSMIGGVCSGLSEYLGIDVSIIRILFVALALFGVGATFILYLILWLVVPEK